ncbi:hypothetical protein EVAR_46747_1 [Eumeta japonica]|uniref:Histone H4 n=1 Tax=Eumeta variegata TaxID=151549 RepID=A0A4C2AA90_EUMVA|nr:hypothetical protein EVAR_46747_1 [Eumeta japonica]
MTGRKGGKGSERWSEGRRETYIRSVTKRDARSAESVPRERVVTRAYEARERKTVTAMDVVYALKRQGAPSTGSAVRRPDTIYESTSLRVSSRLASLADQMEKAFSGHKHSLIYNDCFFTTLSLFSPSRRTVSDLCDFLSLPFDNGRYRSRIEAGADDSRRRENRRLPRSVAAAVSSRSQAKPASEDFRDGQQRDQGLKGAQRFFSAGHQNISPPNTSGGRDSAAAIISSSAAAGKEKRSRRGGSPTTKSKAPTPKRRPPPSRPQRLPPPPAKKPAASAAAKAKAAKAKAARSAGEDRKPPTKNLKLQRPKRPRRRRRNHREEAAERNNIIM